MMELSLEPILSRKKYAASEKNLKRERAEKEQITKDKDCQVLLQSRDKKIMGALGVLLVESRKAESKSEVSSGSETK